MNDEAPPCVRLYTYRRCPYAMRARMALLVAGIPFDAFEIVLRAKPAGLLAASPKATVPVLVLPGGEVIDQSWDIVRWAFTARRDDPAVWAWWSRADTTDNQQLLNLNDHGFKAMLDRYKYPERFGLTTHDDAHTARLFHRQQAVTDFLVPLDARLQATPYLGGDRPCATDIGTFPFVRQFAAVDPIWFEALPLPGVQGWLKGWLDSPLFQHCMLKLAPDTVQRFAALAAEHRQP